MSAFKLKDATQLIGVGLTLHPTFFQEELTMSNPIIKYQRLQDLPSVDAILSFAELRFLQENHVIISTSSTAAEVNPQIGAKIVALQSGLTSHILDVVGSYLDPSDFHDYPAIRHTHMMRR